MPFLVFCPDCGSQLKVPDDFAARKAQCPRCEGTIIVAEPTVARQAETIQESLPRQKDRANPSRPKKTETERVPELPEEPGAPDSSAEVPRKKKRRLKKEKGTIPAWAVWLVASGAAATLVFAVLVLTLTQMKREALGYCLVMLIMLPISTVILILSMFISNALGGGIDMGDVRVGIPKAAALLLVVNTLGMMPCGMIIAGPIWLVGLMSLFHLDGWETRTLWLVNWGLGSATRWFLLAAIVASGTHPSAFEVDREPDPLPDPAPIIALGGECEYEDGPGTPVVAISLKGTRVTDRDMSLLTEFRELRSLDLSDTQISDAGLGEIAEMDQLEMLNLTNTRVSKTGIRDLKRALPDLKIKTK